MLTLRVAVFKMISWYLTNLGGTIAACDACENVFCRLGAVGGPLSPGLDYLFLIWGFHALIP